MKIPVKNEVEKKVVVTETTVEDVPITKILIIKTLDDISCGWLPSCSWDRDHECWDENYILHKAISIAVDAVNRMPDDFFKEQNDKIKEEELDYGRTW